VKWGGENLLSIVLDQARKKKALIYQARGRILGGRGGNCASKAAWRVG